MNEYNTRHFVEWHNSVKIFINEIYCLAGSLTSSNPFFKHISRQPVVSALVT